jgi:hypothetical protein
MACPEQAQLLHRPAVPCFVLELAVPVPGFSLWNQATQGDRASATLAFTWDLAGE